jgi:hypothetical protein
MVMDSCTRTVTEGGKLSVGCTGMTYGVIVMESCMGTDSMW